MNKFILSLLVVVSSLFSANSLNNKDKKIDVIQEYNPNVECSILADEDSIICKFEVIRNSTNDQSVVITWINPNGEISRTRDMIIPAGDISAYDYRHLEGRENGKWTFKLFYSEKEYITYFEVK